MHSYAYSFAFVGVTTYKLRWLTYNLMYIFIKLKRIIYYLFISKRFPSLVLRKAAKGYRMDIKKCCIQRKWSRQGPRVMIFPYRSSITAIIFSCSWEQPPKSLTYCHIAPAQPPISSPIISAIHHIIFNNDTSIRSIM
mgnify:CR=1 FL=1